MSIASEITRLQQAKAAMKAAIEAKGVTVGDVTLDEYADLIAEISGGGGYSNEDIKKLISRNSSLTSFTLPTGITSIGNAAFRYCSGLTSMVIPSGVTSIGISAFERCTGLTSITIPSGVTSIGENGLKYCNKIETLEIPNTVTSIGGSCFSDMAKLKSIKLSTGLTSMGTQNFYNCSELTSIDIPAGVTSYGNYFFYNCKKLATMIIRATNPPTVSSNTFGSAASNYTGASVTGAKTLYVPYGCSSNYTGATSTAWVTYLLNSSKCNFSIAELDEDGNIPT
jgi:hypothetical protein